MSKKGNLTPGAPYSVQPFDRVEHTQEVLRDQAVTLATIDTVSRLEDGSLLVTGQVAQKSAIASAVIAKLRTFLKKSKPLNAMNNVQLECGSVSVSKDGTVEAHVTDARAIKLLLAGAFKVFEAIIHGNEVFAISLKDRAMHGADVAKSLQPAVLVKSAGYTDERIDIDAFRRRVGLPTQDADGRIVQPLLRDIDPFAYVDAEAEHNAAFIRTHKDARTVTGVKVFPSDKSKAPKPDKKVAKRFRKLSKQAR
jgi:hypothetical protein